VFQGLGCTFDLDVAAPVDGPCFVPANKSITKETDGLRSCWEGFVWMNPPFGRRNGVIPWLKRFFDHGDGIGLVNALTSSQWFQEWLPRSSTILFPQTKTKFIRPDGVIAKQPASGCVLFSAGTRGREVLLDSADLGMVLNVVGGVSSI